MAKLFTEYFSTEEEQLIKETVEASLQKSVPSWLGTFTFKCSYNNSFRTKKLEELLKRMERLVPNQKFNTMFLQKYETGAFVAEHRDPRNNVGYTIIAVAGQFTGATTRIMPTFREQDEEEFTMESGDAAILRCTIDGIQGPRHSVSPVLSGTRYALILNTIER